MKAAALSVAALAFPTRTIAKSALSKKKMYALRMHAVFVLPVNAVLCLQRDGCPKVVNIGAARTDMFYERKKYGFKKR